MRVCSIVFLSSAIIAAMALGISACGRSDEPPPDGEQLKQPPVPASQAKTTIPLEGRADIKTDPSGWNSIDDHEGKFSAAFPAAPTLEKQKMGNAPDALMYVMTATTENAKYTVSYSDRPAGVPPPADVDEFLKSAAARAAENVRATVTLNQAIKIDGNAGREVVADMPEKERYQSRFYLVGGRLFQLVTITRNADSSKKDIDRFYSAFKLASSK